MINKKSLCYLTLFSIALVLGIYYITMPNDLLVAYDNQEETVETIVEESTIIDSMRVDLDTSREEQKKEINAKLSDSSISTTEKNSLYEQLQLLNILSSEEVKLQNKIKKNYDFDSFVKKEGNLITVVIKNDKHDSTLANNIMRTVQEEYKDKMYITIQFK